MPSVSRSTTASSAARTKVARRSDWVCRAMTRMPWPRSSLSSRTARMRRIAGSPRLTTAMRLNTMVRLCCRDRWWGPCRAGGYMSRPPLTPHTWPVM